MCTAHRTYVALKADAKEKRDISVTLVRAMDQEFQDQLAQMEMVRQPTIVILEKYVLTERASKDGSVHDKPVEQLRAELEVHQANLEMIMQTNPGVIEQYDKRKAEACSVRFCCSGLTDEFMYRLPS